MFLLQKSHEFTFISPHPYPAAPPVRPTPQSDRHSCTILQRQIQQSSVHVTKCDNYQLQFQI